MAKNKLTNTDILTICNRYVSSSDSLDEISKDYNCSASHISKTIYKAIIFRYYWSKYG